MESTTDKDGNPPEPPPLSMFDLGGPAAPPRPDEAAAQLDLLGPPPEPDLTPEPLPEPDPRPPPAEQSDGEPADGNLLDGVVGQPAAVTRLRAALEAPLPSYLFVGPAGAGLRSAACRFAGELLAARSTAPERERRLVLAEQHPDLLIFDRVGAAMTAEQAREAVRAATVAPAAGPIKVIVLPEVDRAAPIAPILLKSIEEPPPSTVFVLLADEVNKAMETLASRCVRIDFEALRDADLRALLVAEGIDRKRADFAAAAASGSIDRALLLASDEDAAARIEIWRGLRSSLNGTASTAMAAVDMVLETTEQASAPLEAQHADERAHADEQAETYGFSASRGALNDRHRRELRRLQTDELTMGFAALSAQIRGDIGSGCLQAEAAAKQMDAINEAAEALRFNANQRLALSAMFIRLGRSET